MSLWFDSVLLLLGSYISVDLSSSRTFFKAWQPFKSGCNVLMVVYHPGLPFL